MVALTWKEARTILRQVLMEYLEGPSPRIESSVHVGEYTETKSRLEIWMKSWLLNDLDVYIGAQFLSFGLLIMACLSYISLDSGTPFMNAAADKTVYYSQLSAAVFLVISSLIGIWMVRRRHIASSRDVDSVKRREIKRFLRSMERKEDDKVSEDSSRRQSSSAKIDAAQMSVEALKLPGTSLTDIYPVYRTSSGHGKMGTWSRLPTLLLVKGDHVALSVGDMAPAKCRVIVGGDSTAVVEGGERVTSEYVSKLPSIPVPKGRSTLPPGSRKVLELCNNLCIFELLESPLEEFLRCPVVEHKTPLILRQLQAIRGSLSILAVCLFIVSVVIIFARQDITSVDISFILPLPFLAALGVLPVGSPAFLIFLEILGTARILKAAHPHSSFYHSPIHGKPDTYSEQAKDTETRKGRFPLMARYIFATLLSRLDLKDFARSIRLFFRSIAGRNQSDYKPQKVIRIPPASVYLLEKLGVATAFAMVDDELACEPHALPQQLLIPSGKGLKLLDMCPIHGDESGDDESTVVSGRRRDKTVAVNERDSDSDSDSDEKVEFSESLRKAKKLFKLKRNRKKDLSSDNKEGPTEHALPAEQEIQFEDPNWWQHLPALKCIGLACLVVDDKAVELDEGRTILTNNFSEPTINIHEQCWHEANDSLVDFISKERRRNQLRALATCIGFNSESSPYGPRGDITPFMECLRLHVISNKLVQERLEMDPHERGSEEARWWGLLRPDSTSVIIKDARSNAYQLLTAGDPEVVTTLCHEAWQGENSTILPLAAADRATILETGRSWKLADLNVVAFSYTPIPHTFEKRLVPGYIPRCYLLDNTNRGAAKGPISLKDKTLSPEWLLINNQIFLGVLGSLVVPRKEIQIVLSTLSDAGVRFVYFSPRNMRRQKELASQMGIDVAWNCAISLRPLEEGKEDPHRMTSNYADWDVNAKLPHGLENVRTHLREVDNVPLLVSLFTDVTKETTCGMITTFQEYHDTVIAVGLSHLPRNSSIFASADISVAIDIFTEIPENMTLPKDILNKTSYDKVLPAEVTFVSSISAHSCVFRLKGAEAYSHVPNIIAEGRAALEAAIAAGLFYISACLSYSFYMLFCVLSASTAVPFVPFFTAACYHLILLPIVGLSMAWSEPDEDIMNRVPPKNDQTITFGRNERFRLFTSSILKAMLPAVLPQILHLIAYGELMIKFEPELVSKECSESVGPGDWAELVRCDALREYSGVARTSAGALVFAELVLCTLVASATHVHGTIPILKLAPWNGNRTWGYTILLGLLLVLAILLTLEKSSISAMPWYFYVLALIMPFMCLVWNEFLKRTDRRHSQRAEKLRRLQFETRLGMWSPK